MNTKSGLFFRSVVVLSLAGLFLWACRGNQPATKEDVQGISTSTAESGGLPNPASVYCKEKGYTLEIRTAEDGSQQGFCVFPDGSECDEWAYYRGECKPGSESQEEATPTPTFSPVVDMTGWNEYTQDEYGFTFRYPPDWSLEEVQEADNTMSGHLIKLNTTAGEGKNIEMLIGFKRVGEDQIIWPTGVGEGEFIPRGTVLFVGQEVMRNVLVCQNQDMNVFYQQDGGIKRDDLEFSLILRYVGNCLDQYSIPAEIQAIADQVAKSFELK